LNSDQMIIRKTHPTLGNSIKITYISEFDDSDTNQSDRYEC